MRRKAPDFSRGDIRRIAPFGAGSCARMRWFVVLRLVALVAVRGRAGSKMRPEALLLLKIPYANDTMQ